MESFFVIYMNFSPYQNTGPVFRNIVMKEDLITFVVTQKVGSTILECF